MFLSASAAVSNWNADNTACNVVGLTARFDARPSNHQVLLHL